MVSGDDCHNDSGDVHGDSSKMSNAHVEGIHVRHIILNIINDENGHQFTPSAELPQNKKNYWGTDRCDGRQKRPIHCATRSVEERKGAQRPAPNTTAEGETGPTTAC